MQLKHLVLVLLFLLGGCGAITAQPSAPEDDMKRPPGGQGRASAEEMRVYIDETKPDPVAHIRYEGPLRWRGLNSFFAITEARNGPHLIEMRRECNELVSRDLFTDMIDIRTKRGILRAGVDTLRGCLIANFYKLPVPEAVETQEPEDSGETQ